MTHFSWLPGPFDAIFIGLFEQFITLWPIVRLSASYKNQSQPLETPLSYWKAAVKSHCWCHCRGSWVVCDTKGNAIKGAMCTLNLCLISRTIQGCRERRNVGGKSNSFDFGPTVKEIHLKRVWRAAEWRWFRLVLSRRGFHPAASRELASTGKCWRGSLAHMWHVVMELQ